MTAVIDRPRKRTRRRLLTVADLAVLPDELPSGPVKYELDQGRLVTIMAPPGEIHGSGQATIVHLLKLHGQGKRHGKALGEVGVILRRDPDAVRAPDAAFVVKRSLPVQTSPEGYLETIPELVVEVRSKNESIAAIRRKAEEYLHAGVRIVWLIDPFARTVTVCRAKHEPKRLGVRDVLKAEGVIPGFQIRVADLFDE